MAGKRNKSYHRIQSTVEAVRSLRFLFVVQGEGRGHLSQALALQEMVQEAGHEVQEFVVAQSPDREVPTYFFEQTTADVFCLKGPQFVIDSNVQGVQRLSTLVQNILRLPEWRRGIRQLHRRVEAAEPDIIVNFYEILTGLHHMIYRTAPPMVCVGHQYLFDHPNFTFPEGRFLDRWSLRVVNALTSHAAVCRLALSHYPAENVPHQNLRVIPPLLRPKLLDLKAKEGEPYLLVYLLNHGYSRQIVRWHDHHPEIPMHCFWDRSDVPERMEANGNLVFHRLDDRRFLRYMQAARGVVSTAGFDSICEARYLQKPIYMKPVDGHYEQYCNAVDAARAGVGIWGRDFDLTAFVDYCRHHSRSNGSFRRWANSAPDRVMEELEQVV